ncbi:hypothetical protein M407DRAFT_31444 [Tulasnella calospora MUT 4182]|uniref:Protein kinase domain-containing protein n=1 Tax=Tulasnella calospora MUT 4182 TaxID=1051891 RepID=A0A0C3LBM4_9AGAM|nr:hypothetical protein M407DRAFT_31444 [Tulasnella calospora MUT 4182]
MEKFISKLRSSFPILRRRIPISRKRAVNETRLESSWAKKRLDSLSTLRIQTDAINVNPTQPHACGGKAHVVQATLKQSGSPNVQVAVKKFKYYNEINKRKFCNEFVHEVDVMALLSHQNIATLIGFVEDLEEGKAWIILSWEPNGNVREFLAAGEWEIPERISLIKDTFAGIEYLHKRQPPICHGDLKSLNILVGASYRAIITDFGSARILKEVKDRQDDWGKVRDVAGALAIAPATNERIDRTQITIVASTKQLTLTSPAWSLRWAAPEVALGKPQDLASDIWAAGWICWEVMTNKVPFPELNSEGAITLKVVQGENRPNISQCQIELKWMPSIPPLTGNTPHSKAPSAELCFEIGRVHNSQGNFKEAISAFQQALSVARSAGDQKVRWRALRGLGAAYYVTGNDAEAEQYFTQARDICTRIRDYRGEADVIYRLAKVYHDQLKFTLAEEYYTRARNIFSRICDDQGRANTFHGLGNIFSERSQYPEAEESYNRALPIYARTGNDRGRANTLRRLGSLCYQRSEDIKAEKLFNQALEIYSRIGDNLGRANVKADLGDLYHAQGLNTKAAPLFAEARGLYALIGDSKKEAGCSRRLDAVSKQGDSSSTSLSVPGNDDVPSLARQQ